MARKSLFDRLFDALFGVVWRRIDGEGLKGRYFERQVAEDLERLIPGSSAYRNVYVPKNDGSTSEIDIVLRTGKALVAVECKNYAGTIFGKCAEKYWTQVLPNRSKNRFYNPVWQNRTHVTNLSTCIKERGIAKVPVVNLVVFSDRCSIKKVRCDAQDALLMQRGKLKKALPAEFEALPEPGIEQSAALIETAWLLDELSDTSTEAKRKHVKALAAEQHA